RYVVAAENRAGLAAARTHARLEPRLELTTYESFDHELQRGCEHDADRDRDVAGGERDGQADCGADHEVAELHRQPEERVQPVRQPVDRVEDALLPLGDLGAYGRGDRRGQDRQSTSGDR